MTSTQQQIAIAHLEHEAGAARRRGVQSSGSLHVDIREQGAAAEALADALAAAADVVRHYRPIDNSKAETKRVEVVS
jgi:hypothetical protein